ncbi:MAG: hypothetical protein E7643_05185 [Ruminococcaceae bacterium]|nr:hypothetical protein [Oscillospiraceae bacterium]
MDWNEVYGSVKRIASRTAKKINQTADMASLQVKLSVAQNKLEEAYTILGRTAYLHFTGEEDLSKKVALAIDCVEAAKTDVRDIKVQIALAKQKAAEEKAARAAMEAETDPTEETAAGESTAADADKTAEEATADEAPADEADA